MFIAEEQCRKEISTGLSPMSRAGTVGRGQPATAAAVGAAPKHFALLTGINPARVFVGARRRASVSDGVPEGRWRLRHRRFSEWKRGRELQRRADGAVVTMRCDYIRGVGTVVATPFVIVRRDADNGCAQPLPELLLGRVPAACG
jgi:hypothetical protein